MDAAIAFLIALLVSFGEQDLFVQVGALGAFVVGIFGLARWAFARMRARTLDLIGEQERLTAQLRLMRERYEGEAEAKAALQARFDLLDPDRYLADQKKLQEEGRHAVLRAAEAYATHVAPALAVAHERLAEAALARIEDGEAALYEARRHAMGAVAAAPDAAELHDLLRRIEGLIEAAAKGGAGDAAPDDPDGFEALRAAVADGPHDPAALHRAAQAQYDRGAYMIAEALWDRAVAAASARGESMEGETVLNLRFAMGQAMVRGGRYARAARHVPELEAAARRGPGAKAPITLSARWLSALLASRQGRAAEAEAAWRELLPLKEEVKGARHPDTLSTRFSIAQAMLAQKRATEAEAAWGALLPLYEEVQGARHPDTLSTRASIAQAMLDQGRAAEAEAAWRELLPLYEEVQGARHPETLTTRASIARAMLDQGRAAEAEAAWGALLPLFEEVQGARHPETLTTRFSIARAMLDQGRAAEAEAAWGALLPLEEEVKGARHPDTLITASALAGVRARLGDLAGARAAAPTPGVLEEVLGAENPRLGRCLVDLGQVAAAEGDAAGAAALFDRAEGIWDGKLTDEAGERRWLAEARARWGGGGAAAG